MSRVRFMNAVTGEELHLPPQISTRVRTDMPATTLEYTLEWYLKYLASLLEKHISKIRLVTTTVDGWQQLCHIRQAMVAHAVDPFTTRS